MGYPTIENNIQAIGAGLTVDIQPPVTDVWKVLELGSDQWVGVPPLARPNLDVSLFDGTLQAEFLTSVNARGWYRKQNFVIDNTNYLRLTNNDIAAANVSFSAELMSFYGVGASICRSDVQAVAAGLTVDIRPAADTEDWIVHDIGSNAWLGAAPVAVPNVEVDLNDGTLTARVMDSTEVRMWEPELNLYINRGDYITLTNGAAVLANLCWSAELMRFYGTGASVVRSDIQAVGAGLNVDFRPPVGEEWEVTMLGSSVWVGISPAQMPDITVSLWDGTLASTIQTANNLIKNAHTMSIKIDRDDYIRVNDASAAGQNVGISAHMTQMYA